MRLIIKLIIIHSFLVATSFANESNEELQSLQKAGNTVCRTAKNELGICKALVKCPAMLNVMKVAKYNQYLATYLRSSICGYEGKEPVICCPTKHRHLFEEEDEKLISEYLPKSPNCGMTQTTTDAARIVGGKPSKLGTWPWMAAIAYQKIRGNKQKLFYMCGGALITNKFVLTAAHCTKVDNAKLVSVRLGTLRLDNNDTGDGSHPVDIKVERMIAHSGYTKRTVQDDIALLKLEKEVTFSPLIQPICLPTTQDLIDNNFEGYNPFIAGWGHIGYRKFRSNYLQEVQVPVLPISNCAKSYGRFGVVVTNKQLCSGFMEGGKDACQGDSGGPLMLPRGNTTYIIGVVSYGYKCAEKGYPGIYTKTARYLSWIVKNMKANP